MPAPERVHPPEGKYAVVRADAGGSDWWPHTTYDRESQAVTKADELNVGRQKGQDVFYAIDDKGSYLSRLVEA